MRLPRVRVPRGAVVRIIDFFREQLDAMALTKAVYKCRLRGLHKVETIWWRGELRRCCIDCGAEE